MSKVRELLSTLRELFVQRFKHTDGRLDALVFPADVVERSLDGRNLLQEIVSFVGDFFDLGLLRKKSTCSEVTWFPT